MADETNYKKIAYQDVIAFISGKITPEEFSRRYKENAPKSYEYSVVLSDVAHGGTVYDEAFAKSVGMQFADFEPLRRADVDYLAKKIIPVLFQIAYTRTPYGNDPKDYHRNHNVGAAAACALSTLAHIEVYSIPMKYLYEEFFFPLRRPLPEPSQGGMLSFRSVLDSIHQDYKECVAQNAQLKMKNMTR